MVINHKIKMDLVRQGVTPKINVVQGDVYSRKLIISLLSDGHPWRIPENTIAIVRYVKPDRSSGMYDTLADGKKAISFSGNKLSILLAPEMLTLAGNVSLAVTLMLGEKRLSTFSVLLFVDEDCTTSLAADAGTAWIAGFLPSPAGAYVGQHLIVEQVDEQGHILKIRTEDMPQLGKNAYDYAKEAGFTGSEAEFALQLSKGGAEEIIISSQEPTDSKAKIWINPQEENEDHSEGSAAIDVTAAVGQTIRVKAVDSTGKPTAWEAVDLQEKTHGSAYVDEVLLNNQTFLSTDQTMHSFALTDGQDYHIVYNGATYDCTAQFQDIYGVTILGNGASIGMEDTGEPFTLMYIAGAGTYIMDLAENERYSIHLSTTSEIVTPLPQKYLSECLPFYITIFGNSSDGYNTTAIPSMVETAIAQGRQIIGKCIETVDGISVVSYLSLLATIDFGTTEEEITGLLLYLTRGDIMMVLAPIINENTGMPMYIVEQE